MEKNQKASGMTLRPARSLAIHCTMKRDPNRSCATMPKTSQKSNRVTNTS